MVGPNWRLAVVLLVTALAACHRGPTLSNIGGVEALQRQFNADAGKPRIVLLLSPT